MTLNIQIIKYLSVTIEKKKLCAENIRALCRSGKLFELKSMLNE